jgi:single-strand DNA-binding protein
MDAERERLAVLVRTLDGPTVRHLTACADARRHPAVIDPGVAAEELAAMIPTRGRPTVGWWQRHTRADRTAHERERTPMSTTEASPKVVRAGNLTREPELRYSAKGAAWVTTALAVDRRKRGDDGTWEDLDPEFYDVVCFGDLAENVATCLSKGDRVVVVGKVEEQQWTGRDGVERTGHKLIADDVGASLRYGMVEVNRTSRQGPADLDRIIAAQTADELFGEAG